jgi:DNA-binding LacI/PurR family transcriptional regulator
MKNPNSKHVTMNDVAAKSGVSYQTVSRVINNHPRVAPETRDRVLQVIAETGYRPNKAAQRLASNQSKLLAVIAFGIEHYGPAQMVINIEQSAKETDYEVIIRNVANPRLEEIRNAVQELQQWRVDAIIIVAAVLSNYYDEIAKVTAGIPVVEIDAKPGAKVPSLLIDQYHGGKLATQHLIDLGHRYIAAISGPSNWFGAVSRHDAWMQTLGDAGLTPVASLEGDWSAESGYRLARQLLSHHDFTGLVVANDQMALGAIRQIHEMGLRVPEDISIVGFDDLPEACFFHPPLTTVHQDFTRLGEAALNYTIDLIKQPKAPVEQVLIEPRLVVRGSTMPPWF